MEELITVDIQCVPAFILGIITIIAVLCLIFRWFGLKKVRSFYVWIGVLAVLGGAWAFLFPLAINADFGKDGDGAALRQMLIYTTGGVLGVITLGENHRKNSLEKAKNDQDHLRQVHAERRSRYTTAVEQLSSDKASIRLGGVYTLVGLVDEWLSDEKTTPSPEKRRKEGQVIINNLCAYIRSPFLLAERAEQLDRPYAKDLKKDFGSDTEKFDADKRGFSQDKATLEEERQVRQSIIKAIRERLQGFGAPGPWSNFDYDFSNTLFFYSTNFMFSHFDAFSYFHGVTFTQNADFSWAKFTGHADFSWAEFTGSTHFSSAIFTDSASFSGAEFTGSTHFSSAIFADSASFSWAEFTGDAHFSGAEFTSANFSGATFEEKPIFERALGDKTYKARFSCKANPEDYNFEVSPASPYKIETEEQEHNGAKFIIPKGTELFDPDESSE
ncbi:pentapeptide repeat-containing protein [Rothia aeria]|uniref:pentapeptide repeat-containing protein n=1 Tax=Rothia aeria TaxID=172042 RepID=UPI00191916DA|nr:pentapeptide repeat-containing protein [Rothia aeria]QQT89792.1 pentapeptide repeat-containing protein [Rothia aeria]